MKNNGLQNRFPSKVRQVWLGWFSCLLCGINGCEDLHHIMAPSQRLYVAGSHNKSILNSCPIHNRKCHIGNEGHLHKPEVVMDLLGKVLEALDHQGYTPDARDRQYFLTYRHLYSPEDQERVKLRYGWADGRAAH